MGRSRKSRPDALDSAPCFGTFRSFVKRLPGRVARCRPVVFRGTRWLQEHGNRVPRSREPAATPSADALSRANNGSHVRCCRCNAKRARRQHRIVQSTPSASGCVIGSGQRPAEAKRRSGLSDASGAVCGAMPAPYVVSSLRRRRVVSHQARPTSAVTTAARASQRWP